MSIDFMIEELRDRLSRARATLLVEASRSLDNDNFGDYERLVSKSKGVQLALQYVDEMFPKAGAS